MLGLCMASEIASSCHGHDGWATMICMSGKAIATSSSSIGFEFCRRSPPPQRIPEPINLVAVNRVKDSRDTCMLWVSGLNSNDIRGANAMSANTPDRRRSMRLVAVDDRVLRNVRGSDGRPMYRFEPIRARFGSYDNLIDPARDPQTGAARPGTVVTVTGALAAETLPDSSTDCTAIE